MKPDVFFKNFELLADAPNGVQKLRELILQLAVMGKLVPQDPNDEPASTLVERIKSEKKKLDKKGKNNGSRQLSSISADEIRFEIPNNWETIRLGQVYDIEYGKSLSEKNRHNEGEFPVYGSNGIVGFHSEYLVDKPSLIIGRKGSAGAVNLSNKPFWPIDTTYFVTPKDGLDLFFSYYLFKTLDLGKFNKATAIPGLNRQDAYELIINIPPLAEQKRIVSKVDELMVLCDKLEARRQKKQKIQSKLNSAALDRMLSAENQEEFEQYWQRICENFDLLYDNPENVEKLKRYILQLGVEGKLVPTESEIAKNEGRSYESADDLIKSVLIDRSEKETNSKNKSSFVSIELSNLDETLPEGWVWTSIGQIAECLDHMRVPINKKEREERVGNIPYYGANGRVGWIDNYIFDESLVLVVEDETFIGRQKPFSYKIVGKSWVNNHAHVLRPTEAVDVDFLNYSLAYYPFIPLTSGTTGRKKLTKSTLIAAPYKLPPLAEQKRIVEKVEQFMGLCDELESKLRKSRENSEKLMEAVVKGLLEGAAAEI